MKKFLLLFFFISGTVYLTGQPTLQYPQNTPVIGDVTQIQFVSPTGLDLGTAGPDVNWDFSELVLLYGGEIVAIDPTTAPAGGDFPAADVALSMGDTIFTFAQTQSDGYFYLGSQSTTGTFPSLLIYSDSRTFLKFPFTYNDTYFDTYAGVVTTAAATVHNSALTEMTADAYGTLVLPNGTYTNVLRTMTIDAELDSVFVGGMFLKSFPLVRTQYSWFAADSKGPLMSVEIMENTGLGTVDTVAYYTTSGSGIGDLPDNAVSSLNVFPNPANDHVNVSFALSGNWSVDISIVNQVGQVVQKRDVNGRGLTRVSEHFDIADLPSGIYFVNVNCECGKQLTDKFVIR